jgi:DNA modification methylase
MEWGLRNYGESTETVWGGKSDCEHEWGEKIIERIDITGFERNRRGLNKAAEIADGNPRMATTDNPAIKKESQFCVKCGAWKGQLGLESAWQLYVSHMVTVCRELKRVLKRTGSMYIVLGDTYAGSHCGKGDKTLFQNYRRLKVADNLYGKPSPQAKATDYQPKCLMGIPWRLAFALIDDGWVLRERIVWHKGNPMPGSQKDRLTQTCETIFHFVKNSGKALLWRNELTGEWLSQKPKQVYFHVETHELKEECPPKEERYVVDELGSRHLVWKPLWRGFDYYYELDVIREPHQTSSLKRAGNSGVVPFNLRVRDAKRGKKGLYVEDGKVKQLKASDQEVENYVYPEGLTKHDVAVRRFPTVNRQGGLGYTDPLHVKAYHEKGKNPGDTFQTRKKPYIGNNPHRMRLQNKQFLALDLSRPMDLSHPKGKNPGDVVSERVKANLKHFIPKGSGGHYTYGGLDSEEGKHYAEKGKNPGDVLKLDSVACPSGPQRWEREGTNRVKARFHLKGKNPGDIIKWSNVPGQAQQGNFGHGGTHGNRFNHPDGKNPGDFWNVCTKPFKGAHFAVYPEAICINPILSSCPPNGGVVLDPMCGSGTTLVVAKKLGRNFVGIEINPAYVGMARKRLEAVPPRLDTFL